MAQRMDAADDGANPGRIRAVFREIMSGSRALQKVLKVAYLGPEYSFSHLAAVERFVRRREEMRPGRHWCRHGRDTAGAGTQE